MLILVGTTGYYYIGDQKYHIVDCLYMTLITISTIGFHEVIDLSNNPGGRLFTIMIAFTGIGLLTYLLSHITAYILEGRLKHELLRKKMEKKISKLNGHYIVCGLGRVGMHLCESLISAGKEFVIIDDQEREDQIGHFKDEHFSITGDATEDAILLKSGIENAVGIFAATGADNQNLVITLTARLLNPDIRIVTRCEDPINVEKMKKSGANIVVAPTNIGGARMVDEMINQNLIQFLDNFTNEKLDSYTINSLLVGDSMDNKPISDLQLNHLPSTIVIALKSESKNNEFIYNPDRSEILHKGDMLMVTTSSEEKNKLLQLLT